MSAPTTSVESRAIELLGQGFEPEVVASTIGVSISRISQIVSEAGNAEKIAELRYISLSKHNLRDAKYDEIEDLLLDKLSGIIPFLTRPLEISKVLSQINAAKRRGSSAPAQVLSKQEVIPLILPTKIIQNFTLNINNQVIKAGQQELVTVQSGNMKKLLELKKGADDVLTIAGPNEGHARAG